MSTVSVHHQDIDEGYRVVTVTRTDYCFMTGQAIHQEVVSRTVYRLCGACEGSTKEPITGGGLTVQVPCLVCYGAGVLMPAVPLADICNLPLAW